MAGFGVSAVDIIKAISLAKDIYDKCYTEAPASTRYREFFNAIKALSDSLERLKLVVQQHEAQYPHRSWHRGSSGPDHSQNLWEQLTGDFHQTLQECEAVLARQGWLKDGQSRKIDNLRWWFTAEDTIDKLSARLRRHVQNIDIFSKPSEFEAMVRHGRDVQQLRRQLANMEQMLIYGVGKSAKPGADLLSPEMESRLKFAFEENRPEWSTENVMWPLSESFQAFAFHFAQGTVKFQTQKDVGEIPSATQYLELIKSAWILDNIRESPQFKAVGVESRWADFMREFEDDIRGQQNRFEVGQLEKPPSEELLKLRIGKFGVNKGELKILPDPFDASMSGIPEEKILETAIVSESKERDCTLTVFRQTDTDFRLVTATRQADALEPHSLSFEVNMERDRLIPVYGNPKQQGQPRHSLVILNHNGALKREYSFFQAADVQKLQRALTGYRVHHEMRLARWCVNGSSNPSDIGGGTLQLWQYKTLPTISDSDNSQPSDTSSSLNKTPSISPSFGLPILPKNDVAELASTHEGEDLPIDYLGWNGFTSTQMPSPTRRISQNSTHAPPMQSHPQDQRRFTALSGTTWTGDPMSPLPGRTFSNASNLGARSNTVRGDGQSGNSLTTRASVMSPVKGGRTDGTQVTKPQLPTLIIFTEIQGKYSFVHLTLEPRVEVQPKSCGCRKKDNKCNRVILEPKTKDPFSLRILSTESKGDEGLKDWDVSAFRYPPAVEKLKKHVVSREKVKVLELQFGDHIEKKEFLDELQLLINVRTADHNEYEQSLRHKAKKAARPSSKH